ncbi:MAG: nucleotidyltransferase domain-containing protein [Calditrichaeota bacterium]|nr:nucleotidyltransferase domain-containing protein [Calditrichota bacterium]
MREKDSHIARLIREEIKNFDPAAQVILFGSRARGDAKKDSDWDILILLNSQVTLEIERSLRSRLYDLELETGEVFSTFIYNKKIWNTKHKVTPFYQSIKNEGVYL